MQLPASHWSKIKMFICLIRELIFFLISIARWEMIEIKIEKNEILLNLVKHATLTWVSPPPPEYPVTSHTRYGSGGTREPLLLGNGGRITGNHSYLVPLYLVPGILFYLVPGINVQLMPVATQ